ncbi:MAG: T9SS type A sorting domain-containing protein [Bacteroidia bacterium]
MKPFFIAIFSIYMSLALIGQNSQGGSPYSLGKESIVTTSASFKLHPINNDVLMQEDAILASQGEKSLRFGLDVLVNITPETHGEWTTLENGVRLWRIKIKSSGAKSLNFIFDRFQLPIGSKLFIYSPSGDVIRGAYTHENENKLNNFATLPIPGDELIFEYSEPVLATGFLNLRISYVIHGYRDFNQSLKDFGDSGNCNNNVVCPEGNAWNEEKRASVMLLTSNNSRFCSGAAINNTSNDGTPYVLGANHCDMGATDIFMFNYFSPTCSPSADGSTSDIVIGCIPRASNANSDFALVELSGEIPVEYEAFLSGWSRQNTSPSSSTGIHHPRGDVMKITFNTDATEIGQYNGADCWHVLDWEDGTTEGGSSGSPLYNENKQIIGQLFGGTANCNNNVDDYYGRFITSWDANSASSRLRDWLDPSGLDLTEINGIESSAPTLALDIRLLGIISPVADYCNTSSITPEIRVRNGGIQTITSFTIEYSFGAGSIIQQNWSGTLLSNETINITLPVLAANFGNGQVFTASLTNPNNSVDGDLTNNNKNISVNIGSGQEYRLEIVSDNFPEETAWSLLNTTTGTTFSSIEYGELTEGTTLENWCLPAGCYRFVIQDDYGDGICCGIFNGNGSFAVYDSENQVIGEGGNFDFVDSVVFCTDSSIGFEQLLAESFISIYPNPAKSLINLNFVTEPGLYQVELFDLSGRLMDSKQNNSKILQLDLQGFNQGTYLIKVTTATKTISKRIILAQ